MSKELTIKAIDEVKKLFRINTDPYLLTVTLTVAECDAILTYLKTAVECKIDEFYMIHFAVGADDTICLITSHQEFNSPTFNQLIEHFENDLNFSALLDESIDWDSMPSGIYRGEYYYYENCPDKDTLKNVQELHVKIPEE